jgi:S-ribosylhomocysteine lyase
LFATVIRNGILKQSVVYFGPMGCRTGFYLLLLNIGKKEALLNTILAFKECLSFESVPGASEKECGNFKEHDLLEAKKEIADYIEVLSAIME